MSITPAIITAQILTSRYMGLGLHSINIADSLATAFVTLRTAIQKGQFMSLVTFCAAITVSRVLLSILLLIAPLNALYGLFMLPLYCVTVLVNSVNDSVNIALATYTMRIVRGPSSVRKYLQAWTVLSFCLNILHTTNNLGSALSAINLPTVVSIALQSLNALVLVVGLIANLAVVFLHLLKVLTR